MADSARMEIGALRVRVPGRSAAEGRAFAQALSLELSHALAQGGTQSAEFAGGRLRIHAQAGATPQALATQVAARVHAMARGPAQSSVKVASAGATPGSGVGGGKGGSHGV